MQKQKKYLVMQKLKSLRIDWRRKRVDKDDDNNNINFSGGNDNDDEGGSGDNQSQWKFNKLRYNPDSGDNNELICRYNDLRQPIFWDVPPSPPSPLERPTIWLDQPKRLWWYFFYSSPKPKYWRLKNWLWWTNN